MGETEMGGGGAKGQRRPTITVPPRAPFEALFTGGSIPGYSPGPMTLLSNIFTPDSNSCSFSQLLAGAMASPMGKPALLATTGAGDYSNENFAGKDVNFGDGNDKGGLGYKQNRPMGGVVVAQSPLFLVPPGLSPSGFLNSPGFLSPLQSPFGMSHQQALAHVTAQAALSQSFNQVQAERSSGTASAEEAELRPSTLPSETIREHVHSVRSEPQTLKMISPEASQSDKKPVSFAVDKPANDGYNWRKYGQKLVKAKEHPRSYYKCTHPNCPVKKKLERGTDGQITEITYKGQHNHEMPQPNTRAKDNTGLDGTVNSQVKPEFGSRAQTETKMTNEGATCPSNNLKQKLSTQLSSEQFPIASEHDEMEDSATVIDEDNDDDDEPNAKRRSTEVGACVPGPSHKTVTEPKIVVQTRSEVDLLDDGYKWRKYGQKVVKGNPHPRSYYRCTFAGCNVRKHVERASADPKAVITTYEGKHNHDIPAGRNSSHNMVNTTCQLKPQKTVARKPSVHREVGYENNGQMPVLPQLKEGKIAA
ncbi:hypothetical protein ACH5RR_014271 [Cinchona calisaya]|uniref:WRKY domain-containing protein n=1 Tax=Cinchona calisaya TaxID=153742 RepID=A0ABD3A2E0_9GENT